jgi:phage baseplate assembly protein W
MANILDRFVNNVVGTNNEPIDYIEKISPAGDFTRITALNVILRSWNNILSTPTRTYDHDPEFGCDVYKYVFEPADNKTKEAIQFCIMEQLLRWEDRATIEKVEVNFLKNRKGFEVDIYVIYLGDKTILTQVFDEKSVIL